MNIRLYEYRDIETIKDFYIKEKVEAGLSVSAQLQDRLDHFEELYDQHKNGLLVIEDGENTTLVGMAGWKYVDQSTREIGPLYLMSEVRGKIFSLGEFGNVKLSSVMYQIIFHALSQIKGATSARAVIADIPA